MSQEMREAINVIRDFLNGTGGEWDWGDFLSPPSPDPDVRRLQGLCMELPYDFPPEERTAYCSKGGIDRLRKILTQLEEGSGNSGACQVTEA